MNGQAHEKKPNTPVTIMPAPIPEEFADLEPDSDLFGTDDLIGIEIASDEESGE